MTLHLINEIEIEAIQNVKNIDISIFISKLAIKLTKGLIIILVIKLEAEYHSSHQSQRGII